ncbi:MAG: hypothetical protein FJ206_17330 [Gemmatimonadetes bacterium]|nr:hypothetical protein [Gemmatimonadota bacterium]
MATPALRAYITKKMKWEDRTLGWVNDPTRDLTAIRNATLDERNKACQGLGIQATVAVGDPLSPNEWAIQMYLWARRVRRDILAIEKHLKDQGSNPDLYGDPGDPPPPPPDW